MSKDEEGSIEDNVANLRKLRESAEKYRDVIAKEHTKLKMEVARYEEVGATNPAEAVPIVVELSKQVTNLYGLFNVFSIKSFEAFEHFEQGYKTQRLVIKALTNLGEHYFQTSGRQDNKLSEVKNELASKSDEFQKLVTQVTEQGEITDEFYDAYRALQEYLDRIKPEPEDTEP